MAGLILTAKALCKKLAKARMEQACIFDANINDKREALRKAWEPSSREVAEDELQLAIEQRDHFDWDAWETEQMKIIAKDFERQCKMAAYLRDIAVETGLLKTPTPPAAVEKPQIEDSPCLPDRYALITIRPAPGTCLVYFERAVTDFIERPWVLGAEYHFEQTGTDLATLGNGFHVHIVAKCKKSIRATEIISCAAKDFECKHAIQIGNQRNKFLKTERDLEYALNYIRGDKHDDEKEDAVAMNDEWRRINGLQEVYYVGDWDNRESRPSAVIIEEVI